MKKINVVCPTYKNEAQILGLFEMFNKQKDVEITKFVFPYTLSGDEELDKRILKHFDEKGIVHFEVKPEEFSHSLTRERAIRDYCNEDIVVLCSQDIILKDEHSVANLVNALNDEVVYVFGRQICTNKSIEKYIRRRNYPAVSNVMSKEDVESKQLMTFFASDAYSALDRNVFLKLDGYKGYNVMMAEDMLYAKFVIDAGYKKAYVAEAEVEHSHKYTLKQLYKRYYDTGVFHEEIGLFKQYKTIDTGFKLAMYVLGQALKHFDIPVLFRWLPDMTARYLGMKKGNRHRK